MSHLASPWSSVSSRGSPTQRSYRQLSNEASLALARLPSTEPLLSRPRSKSWGVAALASAEEKAAEGSGNGPAAYTDEVRALRQEIQALDAELKAQRAFIEEHWQITESLAKEVMAGANKLCQTLVDALERRVKDMLAAESDARATGISHVHTCLEVALRDAVSRTLEKEREVIEVAMKDAVSNMIQSERDAHVKELAETHAAVLACLDEERNARLETFASLSARLHAIQPEHATDGAGDESMEVQSGNTTIIPDLAQVSPQVPFRGVRANAGRSRRAPTAGFATRLRDAAHRLPLPCGGARSASRDWTDGSATQS